MVKYCSINKLMFVTSFSLTRVYHMKNNIKLYKPADTRGVKPHVQM